MLNPDAEIQIFGRSAYLRIEGGIPAWECEQASLQQDLNDSLINETWAASTSTADPLPHKTLAETMAATFGGTVVYVRPNAPAINGAEQ